MLTGPQNMPKFSDRQLTLEEKKDIIAYVKQSSENKNPGGYGLGGIGPGSEGLAMWVVGIRVVDYTPHYLADHWCEKGHILYCLQGQLETELADGRRFVLKPGMSYQVADGAEPHRSSTAVGAKLERGEAPPVRGPRTGAAARPERRRAGGKRAVSGGPGVGRQGRCARSIQYRRVVAGATSPSVDSRVPPFFSITGAKARAIKSLP